MSESTITALFIELNLDEGTTMFTVQPYEAEVHLVRASRFLFLAAVEDAHAILGVGGSSISTHASILEAIREYAGVMRSNGRLVRGAGKIDLKKVVDWKSWGFKLETPQELQPALLKVLGIPLQQGEEP